MPLTLTQQSPPHLTGWPHPQTGRWEGHRAEGQRNQQSLEQEQCLVCGFLHHSLSAMLVCHFLLEDQGSGGQWLQCLQITPGYHISRNMYSIPAINSRVRPRWSLTHFITENVFMLDVPYKVHVRLLGILITNNQISFFSWAYCVRRKYSIASQSTTNYVQTCRE